MLDKKDKKFIFALIFAQTGLVMMAISFSAYFWHHSMVKLQGIDRLYNFSQALKSINFKNQKKCEPEKEQKKRKIIM